MKDGTTAPTSLTVDPGKSRGRWRGQSWLFTDSMLVRSCVLVRLSDVTQVRQRAIASLAILKVNSDQGADYIDNFVPFVAECLRRCPDSVVSITQLQGSLKEEFGIDIPQGPLRTILDRVVRAGYARRTGRLYERNRAELDRLDVAQTRDRVLREVAALIDKLTTFTGALLPTAWTADEAEKALLHYLADRGTSVLASSAEGIPIALPADGPTDAEYVLSSFVTHLHERDPDGFEFLTTAVKGSVLASVLYFDDFGSIDQQFANVQVFLDTVVLLRALGREGPDQQAASLELIGLAKALGARLHYFPETLRELEGIHEFTAHCLRSSHGTKHALWGAAEFLIASGNTASDIQLLIEHLEDDLRALGITKRSRPDHVVALTVDELAFERHLLNKVGYRRPQPLQHDLDAVTSIHRIRGGEVFSKIETSRAVFVTTNTALARASVSFFRAHYVSNAFAPLCMPDHQFATLLWLKKPLAAPDLPTKYVLADALASLNPPEVLWRAYVREINRLQAKGEITSTDYVVLRYAPAAREALMGVTVGGSRPFLEGSVPEILARVRAAERADAERQTEEEARHRVAAVAALADHERKTDEEKVQLTNTHADERARLLGNAELERATAARDREARRQRFEGAGASVARLTRFAVVALYIGLAALQVYPSLPLRPFGDAPQTAAANPLVTVALVIVAIIAIVIAVRGGSVMSIYAPAERKIASWITRRLLDAFDPDLRDSDEDEATEAPLV